MKYLKLVAILSVFLTIFLSCSNDKLDITKNGKTNYEIVFLGKATERQYKSAEILKKYIDKISGVDIAIVDDNSQGADNHKIYVGNINDEKLKPHELSILSKEKNIFINGGSDQALKNAVYIFIEDYLGVKWYSPTVEKIPSERTISISKNISYNYEPEITTRTVHSRLFYENHEFADKLKVTTEAFPTYVPNARVHTFHKFIPEEKFYKQHPEYFALRGDKRLPTQLCLTNDDVYNIVKDSVASLFAKNPTANVVSVSQDDNTQYCQCENCAKIDSAEGSPSGSMIHFVNKIAENFPEKQISTLAYQHTRKPCKTKPKENVLITLCSIECDRSAPITEKCNDFAKDLESWGKLTNNIRIWDYTTQFTNFLAPFPNIKTLQPNIQLFRDNNAKWIFEQHSSHPSELFELRSYITAKLLWNPDLDVEALITEFTYGYYEEAGIYIKKYVDLIHAELKKHPDFFLFLYGDPSQAFDTYLSPELLATYKGFFDKAEKVVASKPEVLKRVKEARISTDYAILEAAKKNLTSQFSLVSQDNPSSANPFVQEKLENFYKTAKASDITLMNEMGFTVEEYYNSYKKTIEVAVKPNIAKGKKVTLITQPKKYANEDPQTLTDGALGGNNFYANWLGFEGNHLEAVIDLEKPQQISSISTAFLQVTNHVVFYPLSVSYYSSNNGENYIKIGTIVNNEPLTKTSKVNAIKYFDLNFPKVSARYIKIIAENMNNAPYWHHAAGLPSWIFADEVIVE
ncbi:DUF4838 domain-containing protein [Aureibaculum sp. 2210JD6-5]|uniref:DUF4838 domain-containing protein n=1 Tax=Aureibaculum sp. 2210JD6-5 TaxID=3103957 RepID=UPI002AAD19CC|nr:DUF4838 domain-containing protein [Aureibaculum sp. 2210JD6-5]MDY7394317.1 DUF4838 domain-containing protein [Aureibaculum sp. 2210JD6-5]